MMTNLIYKLPLSFYSGTLLFNFVTTFALFTFLIIKNRRSPICRSFALFTLSISVWSLMYYFSLISTNQKHIELFLRTCMIGVLFMPSTLLDFVNNFLLLSLKKILIKINYFISFIFALTVYSNLFSYGFGEYLIFPYWGRAGIVLSIHLVQIFLCSVFFTITMWRGFHGNKGLFRQQILYVFLGLTIGLLVGFMNYCLWFRIPILPFMNILVSLGVGMITYAIVRYRLMDIRVVAVRTLVFIVVYVPILAIPYVIAYAFNLSWVLPTVLETIFAPSGIFIYLKIQAIAERRILQKEYGRAGEIRRLSAGLARLDNVEVLGKVIVEGLENITGAKNISLYVLSKDRTNYFASYFCGELNSSEELILNNPLVTYLQSQTDPLVSSWVQDRSKKVAQVLTEKRAVVAVPAVEKGTLMGIIFLGENLDNREYSQIEIEALSVLARQVAFAVEIIQFIAEKEEMYRAMNEVQRMKEFRYLTSSIGHEVGNGIQSIADAISTFFVDGIGKHIITPLSQKIYISYCCI